LLGINLSGYKFTTTKLSIVVGGFFITGAGVATSSKSLVTGADPNGVGFFITGADVDTCITAADPNTVLIDSFSSHNRLVTGAETPNGVCFLITGVVGDFIKALDR
jgi:hypothetical protein